MVWGENFNYSIWYFAMNGVCEAATVAKAIRDCERLQSQEVGGRARSEFYGGSTTPFRS